MLRKNKHRGLVGLTVGLCLSASVGCADLGSEAEATSVGGHDLRNGDVKVDATGAIRKSFARKVARKMFTAFAPQAQERGAKFALVLDESDKSDASAMIMSGPEWRVRVTTGLLEDPLMTHDALALAMCHELGHLIGGFPFKARFATSLERRGSIIAAEHQSDYFAAKECLPRMWPVVRSRTKIQPAPANCSSDNLSDLEVGKCRCKAQWTSQEDRRGCYRTVEAVRDFSLWLAARHQEEPGKFSTSDPTVMERTETHYGSDQCRLDTMMAGALCATRVARSDSVIPGLVAEPPFRFGEHSPMSEAHAAPYACDDGDVGSRPLCWFKPQMEAFDCTAAHNGGPIPWEGVCNRSGDAALSCDANYGVTTSPCFDGEVCRELQFEDGTAMAMCCPDDGSECY